MPPCRECKVEGEMAGASRESQGQAQYERWQTRRRLHVRVHPCPKGRTCIAFRRSVASDRSELGTVSD